MSLLIIKFILGTANIFLSGVFVAFSFLQKKQGKNLSYKDYLFAIIPICIGIYLMFNVIGELNENCVTLPDDYCDSCD